MRGGRARADRKTTSHVGLEIRLSVQPGEN